MNASLRAERLRGVAKKSLTRSDTGHSLGLDIRPSLAHNDDTIFPETSTVPRPHRDSTSHDDGKSLLRPCRELKAWLPALKLKARADRL